MNDKVKEYLEQLKGQTDSYNEFLQSTDTYRKIKTTDLQKLDDNTPTWFDAFITHPKFEELVDMLISNSNPYFWSDVKDYNLVNNNKVDYVEKLYHPNLGNVLKISISFDAYNEETRLRGKNKMYPKGRRQKDLYLKEGYFIDVHKYWGEDNYYMHGYFQPLGNFSEHNSMLFGILQKLNRNKKLNGYTFKQYFIEMCQKIVTKNYCIDIASLKRKLKVMEEDYHKDVNKIQKKVESEYREFKQFDELNKILDDNPVM